MNFLKESRRLAAILVLLLAPVVSFADVCVWRDPERTMNKLFPEAQDYATITVKVTPENIARIEKRLGAPLDESEKHEFNFYELKSKNGGAVKTLGYAIALAGKGEYGAVEVVIGVDQARKIRAAYIQRSREKAKKEIEDFLVQFKGKSSTDAFEFGKDLKTPQTSAESIGTVRITVKKMLAFYEELLPKTKTNQ